MPRHLSPLIRSICLLGLASSLQSHPIGAATFTVSTLRDGGSGSLRQAIIDANSATGNDTIVFDGGLSGTIKLTGGELAVSDHLTIDGPGANVLAVSGDKASRIFNIAFGATLVIGNLGIKHGRSPYDGGGAVYNAGTLTIRDSALSGNWAGLGGGAVYNFGGTATLVNCVIRGNIEGSTQSGFGGGGIANNGGTMTVMDSTLSGNKTLSSYGGGIINVNDGALTVTKSTLAGNLARGNYTATGGGIANINRGRATVLNSTLTGNSATASGGIANDSSSTLTVLSSTLAGNSAETEGGGIGRGTFGYNSPSLGNTVVANNTARTGSRCGGPALDQGHNLDSGSTCGFDANKGSLGDTDPLLGPLAHNGDPTQTMLLSPRSPAIDAGDNALIPPGVATDQRGSPRIESGALDIGAVERRARRPR